MTTSGWAIKASYTGGDGVVYSNLLNKFYFGFGHHACFDGYQTAVFRTRQLAREAARVAGRGYDHATAVKVLVHVVEPLILEAICCD